MPRHLFHVIRATSSVPRTTRLSNLSTLVHTPKAERTSCLFQVSQIATYLDGSLARVVDELNSICEHCEVGLTPHSRDMTFLSLEDFICSDFDSKDGERDYPSRDCALEDRAWAAGPSSLTAPCCANATLVKASVAMMTEALAYGITELPLETLLSGGTDPSYSSTEYFVSFYIDKKSFILQLIVSRSQRMAGTSFYVGKTKEDAPTRVEVIPGYCAGSRGSNHTAGRVWPPFLRSPYPKLVAASPPTHAMHAILTADAHTFGSRRVLAPPCWCQGASTTTA